LEHFPPEAGVEAGLKFIFVEDLGGHGGNGGETLVTRR
jgi:hypothetical protein